MNKRISGIPLIILAIIFFLGVGYAVVNSVDLNIKGGAESKNQELDVIFLEETVVSDTSKVTATKKENENLAANIEVKDLKLNETAKATFTVQNKELDVHANLVTTSIVNDNEEYFKVTTNLVENQIVNAENGKLDIDIDITLIKTPLTKEDSEAKITITFNAVPVR